MDSVAIWRWKRPDKESEYVLVGARGSKCSSPEECEGWVTLFPRNFGASTLASNQEAIRLT